MNKIGSVIVTHNRLEYTQRTILSYLVNTVVPYELVIVDNNSTDGTKECLKSMQQKSWFRYIIFNDENLYAATARNQGASFLMKHADFDYLHFSDNDIEYVFNWDKEILDILDVFPEVGQVSTIDEISGTPTQDRAKWVKTERNGVECYFVEGQISCIGGNCVVRKEVFDKVKWNEKKHWEHDKEFHDTVALLGWKSAYPCKNACIHLSFGEFSKLEYEEYYKKTFEERGKLWLWERIVQEERKGLWKGHKRIK